MKAILGNAENAQPGRYRVNTVVAVSAQIAYTCIQWITMMAIARRGGLDLLGHYSLGVAIATPVVTFTSFQIRGLAATDQKGEFSLGEYLSVRAATALAGLFIVLLFSFLMTNTRSALLIVAGVAFAKTVDSVSEVFYGIWQQTERMFLVAKSLVLRATLGLLAVFFLAATDQRTLLGVALLLASSFVLVAVDLRRAVDEGRLSLLLLPPNFLMVARRLLALGAPLSVSLGALALAANAPRYLVEHTWGAQELGILAGVAYFPAAGSLVVSAMCQPAGPRLAKLYFHGFLSEYRALASRLLTGAAILGVLSIIVFAAVGNEVLTLMYGETFSGKRPLLMLFSLYSSLSYIAAVAGVCLTSIRVLHHQVWVAAVALVATTIASVLLVPDYGAFGAGFALAIGALVQSTVYLGILHRATSNTEAS